MITFEWIREGAFWVISKKVVIGVINPNPKNQKESSVFFNQNFKGNRQEETETVIDTFSKMCPSLSA